MSNDKRPDPRFAMIAEEMTTEVKPSVIANLVPELMVSGNSITCPRCGLGAFEPIRVNVGIEPMVACLACPPPSRIFPLPRGVKLTTNRYRCCSCGNQPQVTMGLADVNLHCRRCLRLTLHSMQVDPTTSPIAQGWTSPTLGRPVSDDVVLNFDLDDDERVLAGEEPRMVTRVTGGRVIVDEVNDIYVPATDPMLVALTRTMMSILGLEDFDAYAERKRAENLAPWADQDRNARIGLSPERSTGRTLRGIVELLARHYLATTRPAVWVLAGSERMDVWLRNEVIDVRNRLGNTNPEKVGVVPNVRYLIEKSMKVPTGVMLLVDHTYYEARNRRG